MVRGGITCSIRQLQYQSTRGKSSLAPNWRVFSGQLCKKCGRRCLSPSKWLNSSSGSYYVHICAQQIPRQLLLKGGPVQAAGRGSAMSDNSERGKGRGGKGHQ